MERRAFFRAGLAAGVVGLGGPATALAEPSTSPRRPGPLRLDSNENALGLAPAARRAVIDGIAESNRYPGVATGPLRTTLAQRLNVPPEALVFGSGSTEIIRIAAALPGPGTRLVLADPTFEDMFHYATPHRYRPERVPLTSRFGHDVGAMQERAAARPGPVLAYICNPNNPTGTLSDSAEVDAWIGNAPESVLFVVDEAYFEYVEDARYWTAVKWVLEKRNVVVVRTFSKIYAMAGLRVGYGVAHPETAARLRAHVTRNTPNHLGGVAALASLRDGDMIARSRASNRAGKATLTRALDELDIPYLPSHTFFLMHRVRGDLDQYITRMREHEVMVGRPFPPMLGYNRISIGLPEDMEAFVAVLRTFRERGWV